MRLLRRGRGKEQQSGEGPDNRPVEFLIKPQAAPSLPYVTTWDDRGLPNHQAWSEAVDTFQREYCPHGPLWEYLETAGTKVAPCVLYAARKRAAGCPTKEETSCGLYVMVRCNGKSQEKARTRQTTISIPTGGRL